MSEPWQWTALETAAAIQDRKVSAGAVIEAHLQRLAAVNPGLNAVTYDLSEQARKDAAAADAAIAEGAPLGPLHGVPVTIKENVDQQGLPTPNGIADFQDLIAPDHSPVVKNLLAAGAIVIGRTNTPEFSIRYVSENPLRGRTLNPWRDDLTPGGSSGGAAAAVASGIGAIAHGNDLAGSLRYPAYCCGCVTIKPGLGRVPAYNPSAASERPTILQLMSVQGPITRSVADARLALSVMSRESADDPWWCPALLEMAKPERLRIAVCRGETLGPVHPHVAAAVDTAVAALKDAGHEVRELAPPTDLPATRDLFLRLLHGDHCLAMEAPLAQYGSDDLQRASDNFFADVPRPDLESYARDLSERGAFRRRWLNFFQDVEALVMPVSLQPPALQEFDLADDATAQLRANAPMQIVNLLGLPAAAIPTEICEGVPQGVQIIASRFREDIALTAAQAIEEALGNPCRELWSDA